VIEIEIGMQVWCCEVCIHNKWVDSCFSAWCEQTVHQHPVCLHYKEGDRERGKDERMIMKNELLNAMLTICYVNLAGKLFGAQISSLNSSTTPGLLRLQQ